MTEELHVKLVAVDVALLRVQPGDVLLVNTTADLSAHAFAEIRRKLEEEFPGHQILIMAGEGSLSIIRKGGA